jgi:hypothetical protein
MAIEINPADPLGRIILATVDGQTYVVNANIERKPLYCKRTGEKIAEVYGGGGSCYCVSMAECVTLDPHKERAA